MEYLWPRHAGAQPHGGAQHQRYDHRSNDDGQELQEVHCNAPLLLEHSVIERQRDRTGEAEQRNPHLRGPTKRREAAVIRGKAAGRDRRECIQHRVGQTQLPPTRNR